jgi:RNA polymerase sigma factor for flagellar operon FliA
VQGVEIYEESQKTRSLEELTRQHSQLVFKIAKNVKRKLPSHIELNDLIQSGFIGLIEASKTFKQDSGASFETFASIRIKGAMIDELRKNSWSSRDASKSMKAISEAVNALEQKYKRPATIEEITTKLNISIEEYDSMCMKINICNMLSMDYLDSQNLLPGNDDDPETSVIEKDMQNRIKEMLLTFPERERILLSLYYIEELTFKEISEILDLTEARICQIHAAAIAKMKARIEK